VTAPEAKYSLPLCVTSSLFSSKFCRVRDIRDLNKFI
jgi:hypothetical protein